MMTISNSATQNTHHVFNPVPFEHEAFVGNAITVDQDFIPALLKLADFANTCGLQIWVTSSLRHLTGKVNGAIVPPASNSCHHVGHAIDMNILFNGRLYNSKKLKRDNLHNLPTPIQHFIACIRNDEDLRWGGDFNQEDPVHIDDNLYHRHKVVYREKVVNRVKQLNA